MRVQLKNRLCFGIPGAYLLVVILLLVSMDRAMVSVLESNKTISLSHQASQDSETIAAEISALQARVDLTRSVVKNMAGRTFPTLDDVKQLQSINRLRLVQVERVAAPELEKQGRSLYTTVLSGTVGGVVRFLRELEEQHVVKSDLVVLRPANEDGSEVALAISLEVKER